MFEIFNFFDDDEYDEDEFLDDSSIDGPADRLFTYSGFFEDDDKNGDALGGVSPEEAFLADEEVREYVTEIKGKMAYFLKRIILVLVPLVFFSISFFAHGVREIYRLGYMFTHFNDNIWGWRHYIGSCKFGLIGCAAFFVCLCMLSKTVSFRNVLAAFFTFLVGLFTVVSPAFYFVDFNGYLTKRTGMYIPALLAVLWFFAITMYKYINSDENIALWKRLAPGVLLFISFVWWSCAVNGLNGYPDFWSEHLLAGIIVSISAIIYGIWLEMPAVEISDDDLLSYQCIRILEKKKRENEIPDEKEVY
ncbi:MAG: hypothetical protein MJ107_03805 [Lachnospiraceae bacterium]|nr:hypothetical protein [Lachnospiraceae bacterium]